MPEILDIVPSSGSVVRAEDFMPLLTVEQAVERKNQINVFIGKVLKEGDDYGYMPGDSRKEKKKVLLKPGAEKLSSIFGLAPRYIAEETIEDWTGKEHGGEALFYYRYRCQLYRGDKFLGEAVGSANSWEAKHRYRWLTADQLPEGLDLTKLVSKGSKRTIREAYFSFDKRETTGQYGKPEAYWAALEKGVADGTAVKATWESRSGKPMSGFEMTIDTTLYRVPNPDTADVVNTCQKMAQKRALVAAVLVVTNCSDAFTQDLEDADPSEGASSIDTGGHPVGTQAAADHVAQTKINGGPLPKELAGALAQIDKNIKSFPSVCEAFFKQMSDKAGSVGARAYDEVCMKFSEAWPTGCTDKEAMKGCIKELWAAYQKVEPAKTEEMFEGGK